MGVDAPDCGTFGLYVHWPYCKSLCPYCNFNTRVGTDTDMGVWSRAYRDVLDRHFRETAYERCSSIYFGGGTPSLMDAGVVGDVISAVVSLWGLDERAEITLEANPGSSDAQRFRDYRSMGVNRLSVGVQSLCDRDLRRLGRTHTASGAKAAFDLAVEWFDNVSIDLIFGRQHQTLEDWTSELAEACCWGADHLSLYQLTVEPGTPFGARLKAGGLRGLPDDELAAAMLSETAELSAGFGYRQYEVSNFAKPGREGRHNLLYWRGGDYLGVGPGAHGRIGIGGARYATETELSPTAWLAAVGGSGTGEAKRTWLDWAEQANEYLMTSIRLTEGTDLNRYAALSGRGLDPGMLDLLERNGLAVREDDRLRATASGMLVLNRIVAELLR